MTDHATATCRSCRAAIIWTTNVASGKRMPVNAEPDEQRGNVVLVSGNDGPEARVLTAAELAARVSRRGLHLSHFATCSEAARWRR